MEILNTYTVNYIPGPSFEVKTAIITATDISAAVNKACEAYKNVVGIYSANNSAIFFEKINLNHNDKEAESKIEEYLKNLDVKPTFKGFECLKLAILYSIRDGKVGCLVKDIFPRISEKTGYSRVRIDRNIRWAIQNSKRESSTVREFIASAFYDIKKTL